MGRYRRPHIICSTDAQIFPVGGASRTNGKTTRTTARITRVQQQLQLFILTRTLRLFESVFYSEVFE